MSLNDLLNTNVEVIGARLQGALGWWLDELHAMAGPLLSQDGVRRGRVVAERGADGGYRLRHADGRVEPVSRAAPRAVVLALAGDGVLVRTLPAPPLPDRDLRRYIVLELDRLTPFSPDTIYYALAIDRPAGAPAQLRLAVAPRARAEQELADAEAAGLEVVALVPPGEGGAGLDLLPALRAAATRAGSSWRIAWLWAAVAVLVGANVGVAIWRDVRDVSRLEQQVAADQPVVDRVHRLRREAQDLRRTAQARRTALAAGDPLRVIDALSRTLPGEAYATRLSWDGASVRVAGVRRNGVDVVEALRREPLFTDARNVDAAAPSGDAAFDITAQVRRPPPTP